MRALSIAVIAAALAIPSLVRAQDNQGPIGPSGAPVGPSGAAVGPTLGAPSPAASPATQPFAGYPAQPGSEAPRNLVATPAPGGFGFVSASVNGHEVIINPTTNTIVRVIN
jgi:hypothetical protein